MNLIRKLLRPEIDDLVAGFTKLEAKLAKTLDRHFDTHALLTKARAEIDSEIEDTKAEIQRATRIAAKIRDLVA